MESINILTANIPLILHLQYPDYLFLFEPYRTEKTPVTEAALSPGHIEKARRLYHPDAPPAYIEATEIASFAGAALLPFHRAIFHSVAFTWQDRGYLLTAPSGTGKTTQYALWKKLCGDAVQIINGDKPALAFAESEIMIHPTPWAGKENMAQRRTAPLCGIIILEQAQTDELWLLPKREAISRILCQFLLPYEQPEEAAAVAGMTERLLREIPVWLFRNRGRIDGTRLCRDALLQYEKERQT